MSGRGDIQPARIEPGDQTAELQMNDNQPLIHRVQDLAQNGPGQEAPPNQRGEQLSPYIEPEATAGQGRRPDDILAKIEQLLSPAPLTEQEIDNARNTARESLKEQLGKLVGKERIDLALSLQDAVLTGDKEAIKALVNGQKPEVIEGLAEAIGKNLEKCASGVNIVTDGRGNLIVSGDGAQAVKYFANGEEPDVVEKAQDADGNTVYRPADYPNERAAEAMASIGETGLRDILRPEEDRALATLLRGMSAVETLVFIQMLMQQKEQERRRQEQLMPKLYQANSAVSALPNVSVG